MMTAGLQPNGGGLDVVYVAANMAHFASWSETPEAPEGYRWLIRFNSGDQNSPILASESTLGSPGLLLGELSIVIVNALALA